MASERVRVVGSSAPGPRQPSCSVVIATHDRPATLAICLEALGRLEYPRELLEVIVVDDGGSVPLEGVLRPLRDRLSVRLLTQSRAGQAVARNAGAGEACGELLAFTDDDCDPSPGWLATLAEHCASHPSRAAGGHTANLSNNLFAAANQLIFQVGYSHENRDREAARYLSSNNLVVPAEAFRSLGGFDPALPPSEDRDFCDRWVAAGYSLAYLPEAVVLHLRRPTLRSFVRQHFGYGQGAFRFHAAAAKRASTEMRVKPERSYYLRLLTHPFRVERPARATVLAALLQVRNVVNTSGFVWEWVASRRSAWPRRPRRWLP